jgi:hypothetical protein
MARPFLNFDSPFQKVSATLAMPDQADGADLTDVTLRLEYWSAQPSRLEVRGFADERELDGGVLPPSSGAWIAHEVVLRPRAEQRALAGEVTGVHGTGAIAITDVRALDGAGVETFNHRHGDPFELEIGVRIQRPDFRERPQVVIAFMKDGVQDVCRIMTRNLTLDANTQPTGAIRMRVPRLMLAPGRYAVSVMIAREGYYDQAQAVYFSVNPNVHACLSRVLEIAIHGGGQVASGTVFVGDADWSLTPDVVRAAASARQP